MSIKLTFVNRLDNHFHVGIMGEVYLLHNYYSLDTMGIGSYLEMMKDKN